MIKQNNETTTPSTTTTSTTLIQNNNSPTFSSSNHNSIEQEQQQHQQQQLRLQNNNNNNNNNANSMSTHENFNAFRKTIAASGGAFVTSFIVLPLDVIKTRLQFQVQKAGQVPPFKGTLDGIQYIVRNDGLKALWRGLPPTLLMQIPATGIYYTLYDFLKKEFGKTDSFNGYYAPLVSGCTARVFAATITCPLEFVRTNMQAHSVSEGRVPRGVLATVKHSVTQRGWRSMWTGLAPTVIRDAPFSALYWAMFEYLKDSLASRWFASSGGRASHTADPRLNFVAGASAGMLAAAVTNPVDVVKTRMQGDLPSHIAQKQQQNHHQPQQQQQQGREFNSMTRKTSSSSTSTTRTTMDVVRRIIQEEGMKPFIRGIVPRVMRVAPSCAIMISSYEIFKKTLHTP